MREQKGKGRVRWGELESRFVKRLICRDVEGGIWKGREVTLLNLRGRLDI